MVRVFIAIDFPKEIIEEIQRVQEELKKKNILRGKLIEEENLHLTLKFLGELEEDKVNEIKNRLRRVDFPVFEGFLGELGVFSPQFIRIIWIHVLGKKTLELQEKIDSSLEGLFEKEERFMSHLTIARVKDVADKKLFLKELDKIKVKNLGFRIDKFYLMKSELPGKEKFQVKSPIYSILEEFKLK